MARFKTYKTVINFNDWKKKNDPDKIYAITNETGDVHYFDVYEDDFIEMIEAGLVNPTEKEIAAFAAKYGILWLDLEH